MITTTVRTDERNEFLTDILTGAIENYGYGWFTVDEYVWDVLPGGAYADITEDEGGDKFHVDLDVIAKGIGVIRRSVLREITDYSGTHEVLHNAETGERLYMWEDMKEAILAADRANDAAGDGEHDDLDVIAYLAVLECGLFGKVVYG